MPKLKRKGLVVGSKHISSQAARDKKKSATKKAESRRQKRLEEGDDPIVSMIDVAVRGRAFLDESKIAITPATLIIAERLFRCIDAADVLYDLCVKKRTEPRLVSSMVSADKRIGDYLTQLGLPGDLEIEVPRAKAARSKPTAKGETESTPKDGLEAWE